MLSPEPASLGNVFIVQLHGYYDYWKLVQSWSIFVKIINHRSMVPGIVF